MDLTEAEILRRGGKNAQKNNTKKDLNEWDNHNGVFTHLEPDILECEVKLDHRKSKRFQKNIYFCFIDYAKAFDCMDHSKLENSQRNGNTRPPYLPPEKSVCRS